MKKKEKINKNVEEESQQEYIEQEDGIKDPVLNRTKPIETFEYESEYLKNIEDERKKFLASYKSQNRFRVMLSCIGIALCIVIFVVIPNTITNDAALPVMLGSIGFVLCSLLAYSFYTRRRLTKKMHEYFNYFYQQSNAYTFDSKEFKKIEIQTPDKLTIDQFTDCMMYKDIVEVGSRGLTSFEYNKIPVMCCDCAGQIKTDKRIQPVFVGKYLFAPSNYSDDNIMIIYIKGDERSLPPSNIEGLKTVINNDRMHVLTNNKNYSKVLTKEIKNLLDQVTLSQDLVDLAISLTPGRMFVCMGYDDPLIVIPMERPYNPNPIMTFKNDLKVIMKLIEEFNK